MPLLNTKLDKNILNIQLNDPESRNAFSPAMAEEFVKAIDTIDFSGLLVSATGPLFCSGGNLRFYKNLESKDDGLKHNKRITEILDRLQNLSKPTVCVVPGPCYGGGVELVSAFDYVLATPASLFGLWQRRIGLTFGWGGEARLKEKIGSQNLRAWLHQAQTVSSYQAHQWGLVDQVKLEEGALATAGQWLQNVIQYGEDNFKEVKSSFGHQGKAFQNLWMGEHHRQVLDRF